MTRFRVVRLIEHTYESGEAMAQDMGRWQMSGTGVRTIGGQTIRYATLPAEVLPDIEPPTNPPTTKETTTP